MSTSNTSRAAAIQTGEPLDLRFGQHQRMKAEFAWALSDHCSPSLTRRARNMLYTVLGAGDYDAAIAQAAGLALRHDIDVPGDLQTELMMWAHANPVEARSAGVRDYAAQTDSSIEHRKQH